MMPSELEVFVDICKDCPDKPTYKKLKAEIKRLLERGEGGILFGECIKSSILAPLEGGKE